MGQKTFQGQGSNSVELGEIKYIQNMEKNKQNHDNRNGLGPGFQVYLQDRLGSSEKYFYKWQKHIMEKWKSGRGIRHDTVRDKLL